MKKTVTVVLLLSLFTSSALGTVVAEVGKFSLAVSDAGELPCPRRGLVQMPEFRGGAKLGRGSTEPDAL